ncbi:hypothetical protein LB503_011056 [Fusarium chuoi]|nr:hypothetical protein LB503_011056 [Fusarium chuoi]
MTYEQATFESEEGRAILYVFLSLPSTNSSSDKLRVYLQAAIHGNEPAADESVLAFLGKMDAEPSWAKSILEKMDIKILPRYNILTGSISSSCVDNQDRSNGSSVTGTLI